MLTSVATAIPTPLAISSLVIIAMIAIAFTHYRFVLGYFIAGMLYWLCVETLQWTIEQIIPLAQLTAYLLAIVVSVLPLIILMHKPYPVASSLSTLSTKLSLVIHKISG